MKDLLEKVSTKAEIKVRLKKFAKGKEEFTTKQAMEDLPTSANRTFLNGNRVAQYLRGVPTHEYHKGLKRWIRVR